LDTARSAKLGDQLLVSDGVNTDEAQRVRAQLERSPSWTGSDTVEVSIQVAATPEELFPYFTDPLRYVQWMGQQAQLDPVPGGVYRTQMGDGFGAEGSFLEIDPPVRLVFTWGWAAGSWAGGALGGPAEEQRAGHRGARALR